MQIIIYFVGCEWWFRAETSSNSSSAPQSLKSRAMLRIYCVLSLWLRDGQPDWFIIYERIQTWDCNLWKINLCATLVCRNYKARTRRSNDDGDDDDQTNFAHKKSSSSPPHILWIRASFVFWNEIHANTTTATVSVSQPVDVWVNGFTNFYRDCCVCSIQLQPAMAAAAAIIFFKLFDLILEIKFSFSRASMCVCAQQPTPIQWRRRRRSSCSIWYLFGCSFILSFFSAASSIHNWTQTQTHTETETTHSLSLRLYSKRTNESTQMQWLPVCVWMCLVCELSELHVVHTRIVHFCARQRRRWRRW